MNTEQPKDQIEAAGGASDVERVVRLVLTGDENVPDMPMTDAQVNHLRRLLAWMCCEWMLDENMQRGYVNGAAACVQIGAATPEQAGALLMERAEQMNHCPAYVRQAVKMLTKALRDHERAAGVVDPNIQASWARAPTPAKTETGISPIPLQAPVGREED